MFFVIRKFYRVFKKKVVLDYVDIIGVNEDEL